MTAKGKMCADVFISASDDNILVDAEPSLRESLAARIERYIISDDVTVEDVTDDVALFHLIGPAGIDFQPSGVPCSKRTSNRYGREGADFFMESSAAADFEKSLTAPVIDDEMLETLRIETGVPRWGFELDENTIPVEASLDKTAVDYQKGCYIGQEVISRLKSIGHVNRELRGFISLSGEPLVSGMRLSDPAAPERDAGRLTSVTHSFALENPVALGYLKRGIVTDTLNAHVETDAGNTCRVLVKELPFIP